MRKDKKNKEEVIEEEIIVHDDLDILSDLQGLPLDQQIEKMGQEILANAILTLQRLKHGKLKKVPQAEIEKQEEMQRQFKYIQSTYSSLLKLGKVGGAVPNNEKFENELLERIKRKQSSLGSIVTKVPRS